MKKHSALIAGIILTLPSFAQFNMEDYLSQATQAANVKVLQAQHDYINTAEFRSPVLREVDVRFRETVVSQGLESYRLRLSPLNPFERQANKAYKSAIGQHSTSQLQLSVNETLFDSYRILIRHYELTNIQQLLDDRISFYNELLELAKRQPESFSMRDVISIDKDLLDAELEKSEITAELQTIDYLIRQNYSFDGDISWGDVALTDVNQVREWTNSLSIDPESALAVQNAMNRVRLEESIYEVNRQESFSNLGFVQAEYNTDNERNFSQNLGFQLGINIPIVNPDRPDLERRKMDLIESGAELEEEKSIVITEVQLLRFEIKSLIEQYDLVTNKISNYLAVPVSDRVGGDDLDLLKDLREYQLDLETQKVSKYAEVLEKYIESMAVEGRLVEAPYINYLSYSKKRFQLDF